MDLNIYQILWESGPVVKSVLVILVICSIYSWAIIFQKRKLIQNIEFENASFLSDFKLSADLAKLEARAKSLRHSSVAAMFRSGHEELKKIEAKISELNENDQELILSEYINNFGIEALERSLKKGASHQLEILDSRLSLLASVGSISPFIGLFGTVWGIINSFTGLASGGGSIEAVAPGIAEALVATAIGLAAAIPAVWAYNLFGAKITVLSTQMEAFGQDFLNLIQRSIMTKKGE